MQRGPTVHISAILPVPAVELIVISFEHNRIAKQRRLAGRHARSGGWPQPPIGNRQRAEINESRARYKLWQLARAGRAADICFKLVPRSGGELASRDLSSPWHLRLGQRPSCVSVRKRHVSISQAPDSGGDGNAKPTGM